MQKAGFLTTRLSWPLVSMCDKKKYRTHPCLKCGDLLYCFFRRWERGRWLVGGGGGGSHLLTRCTKWGWGGGQQESIDEPVFL